MDLLEKLFDTGTMEALGYKIIDFLNQNPDIAKKLEKQLSLEHGISTHLLKDDWTLETFSVVMKSLPKVLGREHSFLKYLFGLAWENLARKMKE